MGILDSAKEAVMKIVDSNHGGPGRIGVYSVFDSKANLFMTPFFQVNDASAVRTFADLARDQRSSVAAHAEDYFLFRIGNYDSVVGSLVGEMPKNLGVATNFLAVTSIPGGSK